MYDSTIVASVYTAIHPLYGKIYYSNAYRVSLDGRKIEIFAHMDDLETFPCELNYTEKFSNWMQDIAEQLAKKKGAFILSRRIKKELIEAVWHPRRVARMLEVGGWDAIEAM